MHAWAVELAAPSCSASGSINVWISDLSNPEMLKECVMREKVKLLSSAGTGYFYTTTKNKKKSNEKIKRKKYDPKVRKHVEFVETKLR